MVRRSHKQKVEEKREFRKQKKELVQLIGYCMYYNEMEKLRRLRKEVSQELANKAIELFGLYHDVEKCRCYVPELNKYNFNEK